MAGRGRPSRQELIRRQKHDGFVGRRGELATFRENLGQDPEDGAQFLFHIRGQAGVGKSTLVGQMAGVAREQQAATACVDETAASVVEAMEAVCVQLRQQGMTLKGLEKQLGLYRQRRHEAEAGTAAAGGTGGPGSEGAADPVQGSGPAPSASSVVVSQVGLAGLGMVPGLSAFTGAVDANQVAVGADRLRAMLSTRFRSQDDVQLLLSPLQVLTPAFLEDLHEVTQRVPWVVLFFDTYERTGPILDTWLRDMLFTDRYGALPANVIVVLAGQPSLEPRCWGDYLEFVTDLPLEVFTEVEARQLLSGKGVTDERVVQVILQLSRRLPVLVSTLAESRPADADEVGDPSGTAVERFLKWESDTGRRAAALACALPQELDEDVYRAAVDQDAAESFRWLRTLPFVTDRSGRCHYHDVVRTAMLRLQRTESPHRWQEQHNRLADAFQAWRQQLQQRASERRQEEWWDDQQWREYRLQETYHRLCASPINALPHALRELLDAFDHGHSTLRRWVQTLSKAGDDTTVPALVEWARELQAALEEDAVGIAVLTLLLTRGDLKVPDRVLAHALRGREHRISEEYALALADYDAAIALDTDAARPLSGRGETYRLTGRYEDALTDLDRAIALDPDDAWTIASRGLAYFLMARDEQALADFDRAIRLDPEYASAIASRGETYRLMGRYEDALMDFNHAAELDPEYAWAIGSRGQTHMHMGRYEEALTDFDRAVELDPGLNWVISHRGETHRLMGRYEDALTDLDRTIELAPEAAWAIASRGQTHQHMGRYEEALIDFDRAIELDPEYAWAITNRGETHRLMDRDEEALADFDRTIELNPGNAWSTAHRAATRRALGHHEDALADFDSATEIEPEYAWAIANRGETYRLMGRYEDALTDLDRAIELDPEYAWAIASRGQTHQHMDHHQQALTDFDRAIELNPGLTWALAGRGHSRRLTGRHEEALADFDRAAELDPDDAWTVAGRAVTHRAMGHQEEALTDFDRATELLTRHAAGTGREALRAMGSLFMADCMALQWDRAGRSFDAFMHNAPGRGVLRDTAADLEELVHVLPSIGEHMRSYRQRLQDALEGAGGSRE